MAKLEQYRTLVKQLIKQYGAYKPSYGDIDVETVFDTEHDHYELINVG